ncbi:MAG: flagellar hook basal-body protein [Sedimentisphaerales bacterium]|nr:flagellar hook basal-body protein [Sedimentisphaerales bacterium]
MASVTEQISSSIDTLTRELDIIAHNLANASTVGYKRRCNAFSKTLEQQLGSSSGNNDSDSSLDFSQGNTVETGRPLDLALYGDGFFVLETPDGPLYTRNGVLHVNQNNQIVDSMGRIVAGQSGPIVIPNNVGTSQLSISSNGTISANGMDIGTLNLVTFEDESMLVPIGESCYRMSEEGTKPTTAENIVVKQGYQEASNVKIIDELVGMILVSRLYEANIKTISALKETSSSLTSIAMG